MKTHINIGLTLFAIALMAGCGTDPEGSKGATGAPGQDGPTGNPGADFQTTTFAGTVDNAGSVGGGFIVSLTSIAPDGTQDVILGADVSDTSGAFAMTQTQVSAPSTKLRYEAYGDSRAFTALVTDLEQTISPATTAVEQIVTLIAGAAGGPSYSDYSNTEIISSVADAQTALTNSEINILDDEAIFEAVLFSVGESIADFSEVDPVIQSALRPQVAAPEDVQVASTESAVTLSNDLEWSVNSNGTMGSGAFSNSGFRLRTTNNFQFSVDAISEEHQIEDGREVVLGPMTGFNEIIGLSVTRKIYIPTEGNWGRWIEVFENTSSETITLSMMVESDLDSGDEITGPTSSGDTVMNTGDTWVTIDDDEGNLSGRESVGWYFPGADRVLLDGDDVEFVFELTVPAAQRVTFVHWQFRGPSLSDLANCDDGMDNDGNQDLDSADPDCLMDSDLPFDAATNPVSGTANEGGLTATTVQDLAQIMTTFEQALTVDYFAGMTASEINDSNFTFVDNPNNVTGGAGSVAPGALVTVTHTNSGFESSVAANMDGSFTVTVPTASGDDLELSTDFGRQDTLTTP